MSSTAPDNLGYLASLKSLLEETERSATLRDALSRDRQYALERVAKLVAALKSRESGLMWSAARLVSQLSPSRNATHTDWDAVEEMCRSRLADDLVGPSPRTDYARDLLAGSNGPILLDATNVCRRSHGTGISRVVEEMGSYIAKSSDCPNVRMSCFCCDIPCGAGEYFGLKELSENVPFFQFREIVLLDASWEYLNTLRSFLPAARRHGVTVTTCVYDIIPLEFPEFVPESYHRLFAEWFDLVAEYSSNFICISKTTAETLAKHLGCTKRQQPRRYRIGHWPLGSAFSKRSDAKPVPRPKYLPDSYALMVGTLAPHKNHLTVIKAMEQLWGAGSELGLVVAGRSGHGGNAAEKVIANHPELGGRLHRLADVDDSTLEAVYANARLVIQASFVEGYGLPVVEAAAHGCAVALSDIPIFRELVQDGGYFFDPASPESIVSAVATCLRDGSPAARVPFVSWQESARSFLDVVISSSYPITLEH
jgi:glycosyltransferase involved in cell wall biosynthesis